VSLGEDADDCAAQDLTALKGKILRLDVGQLPAGPGLATRALLTPSDNPYAADPDTNARLVYAYGLRNPFRFQFDRTRNWLVIADVGELDFEEIDLLDAGGIAGVAVAAAGANFGWPWLEGTALHETCAGTQPTLAGPAFVLDRRQLGATAIISGGAYHRVNGGAANWPAAYEGDLFFGEYYTGDLRRLKLQAGSWAIAPAVTGQGNPQRWATGFPGISDFRLGSDGALWLCRQYAGGFARNGGVIERIVPLNGVPVPPPPVGPRLRLVASPQPADGVVTVSYDLAGTTTPAMRFYDARGRLVREIPGSTRGSTHFVVVWDGRDDTGRRLPAGLYWARLDIGTQTSSCRVVLLR